jgi:hypothetical protein
MFYLSRCARAFALGLLTTLLSFSYASAHCFVGARFFPATLATDDPCVADEMSLPTVAWFKTGDNPPASEVDISVDISKRITEDLSAAPQDFTKPPLQPTTKVLTFNCYEFFRPMTGPALLPGHGALTEAKMDKLLAALKTTGATDCGSTRGWHGIEPHYLAGTNTPFAAQSILG